MRLIDADKILEKMQSVFDMQNLYLPVHFQQLVVDDMPTVDAEPVVRCKDCRWYEKEHGGSYGYCNAAKHGYYSRNWEISIYRTYKDDFYCADGERREEVSDDE